MAADLEKRKKQEVGTTAAEHMDHSGPAYRPDVDIYASDDKVVFAADMPGVGKGDVTINVDETDSLIIKGKNSFKEPENIAYRQYNTGDYYRAFQLSDEYDKDKIEATLKDGLLKITIPKKEEAKPRKIEIKA